MTIPAAVSAPFWQRPAVLDRFEQGLIVLMWLVLATRIEMSGNPWAVLILLSETSVVLFTLIRRPTDKVSMRLGDWLLAMTATGAPLLIVPGVPPVAALIPLGVGLIIVGNLLQLWAKLTLRRSFGIAPANRGIKKAGPYRLVRHPMYAGYALTHLSALILMFHPLNLLIYALGWTAQILRLHAEERLLSADPDYAAYCGAVRWRLIPGLF
ncbi:MAG: methyltransferase family protein [Chakrabartia sp.]